MHARHPTMPVRNPAQPASIHGRRTGDNRPPRRSRQPSAEHCIGRAHSGKAPPRRAALALCALLWIGAWWAGAASAGTPPFITIGSDPFCTLTSNAPGGSIAVALSTGTRDIRLVGGEEYVGQFTLPDYPVTIQGGYFDCDDAASGALPEQPQPSVLRPGDFEPWVLQFNGGGTSVTSRLHDVALRPSPSPAGRVGKGLFVRTSTAFLVLQDSLVEGFRTAGDGGGALVAEGAVLTLIRSRMLDNAAANGGAIACSGGGVLVDSGSELRQNEATSGNGGAIAADNCRVQVHARFLPPLNGFGIAQNRAAGHGGGIHMAGGLLELQGGPVCPVSGAPCASPALALLIQNSAQGNGGALSLARASDSTPAFAIVDFVHFSENRAGPNGLGGAVYVAEGSEISIGPFAENLAPALREQSCQHPGRPELAGHCVFIEGNTAGSWPDLMAPGAGAAVATVQGNVQIRNALLYGNRAYDSVLLARGVGATLRILQSALLADVPGVDALSLEQGASGTIEQSFLESDSAFGHTLRLQDAGLSLNRSYISHANAKGASLRMDAASTLEGACNAVTGLEFGGVVPGIAVDREEAGGFLPIPLPGSRLLDRCEADAGTPARDVQGNPRVRADSPAGEPTPLDIGPYEYQGQQLFGDGFESAVPT